MADNLPEKYDQFHHRDKDGLHVGGREVRLEPQCKVCRLFSELLNMGLDDEEAMRVEKDVYRMIYTLYSPQEISGWLQRIYGYDVSHDSVYRHIKNHCPDPHLMMAERLKKYRPAHAQSKFIDNLMDTMRHTLIRYSDDLAQGLVEIKPADFLRIAETYKEWHDESQDNQVDKLMQALMNTLDKVVTDPTQRQHFEDVMRAEIEKLEE